MAELTNEQKLAKHDELVKENATLKTDNESKTKEVEAATKVVADLKAKLAEKEAGTVQLPTIKVGSDTYELTSDFFFSGQEITIDVLRTDSELAQTIVKRGITNLRKLTAKKA